MKLGLCWPSLAVLDVVHEWKNKSIEEERSSFGAPAAGISWVKVGPTALSGPLSNV